MIYDGWNAPVGAHLDELLLPVITLLEIGKDCAVAQTQLAEHLCRR